VQTTNNKSPYQQNLSYEYTASLPCWPLAFSSAFSSCVIMESHLGRKILPIVWKLCINAYHTSSIPRISSRFVGPEPYGPAYSSLIDQPGCCSRLPACPPSTPAILLILLFLVGVWISIFSSALGAALGCVWCTFYFYTASVLGHGLSTKESLFGLFYGPAFYLGFPHGGHKGETTLYFLYVRQA